MGTSIECHLSQDQVAPPGSFEAIESGCVCKIEENNFGLGRTLGSERRSYLIDQNCPVHGGGVRKDDTSMVRRSKPARSRGIRSTVQAWPEQMSAEIAAVYCGEKSASAFRRSAGKIYPEGRRISGKGLRWLRSDLEAAILRLHEQPIEHDNSAPSFDDPFGESR